MSLLELPITALGRGLRAGSFTAEELTRAALARIEGADGGIHAFVRVEAESAVTAARSVDAELREGRDRGPMHGIPYATKDIYDVAGLPTTCHSHLRLDHSAGADAAVTERFRAAGAVLLGKLATFEFALGGTSFDLPFPPTRNPWNVAHIPGGSSSGSAAAVAAGFVRLATGSCTAGSIRGPAAWCGVVGLKPTLGRVSRRGVFPLAWTLDHCGPLARSVEDTAIALGVMAGHDSLDPASADQPVPDYQVGLNGGVKGLRVGVPWAFFEATDALTPDARDGFTSALAQLRSEGATVRDAMLPDLAQFLACGRVIMAVESFTIHRDDLARRFAEYGEVAARRFAVGAGISAADYLDAQRLRGVLAAAVDDALRHHDVLITLISLATAPPFASRAGSTTWPLQASLFNVTGHPAISVPVGLGRDGLPLAVQVVGRFFDEVGVLRVARALERLTGWERVPLPDLDARSALR